LSHKVSARPAAPMAKRPNAGASLFDKLKPTQFPPVKSLSAAYMSPPADVKRTPSTESMDSGQSASEQQQQQQGRKDAGKRKMTVTDLATLVRQKSATIDELRRALDKQKAEYEGVISSLRESFQSAKEVIQTQQQNATQAILESSEQSSRPAGQEKQQLTQELSRLQAETSEFRQQAQQKEEESDEIRDLARQELAKVKHMLLNAETQLAEAHRQLDATKCEADAAKRDAERARRESDLRQQRIDRLQEERSKELEERRSLQATIKSLLGEKDDLEKRLDEQTGQLNKTQALLANVERSGAELHTKNQCLQKESEQLQARLLRLQAEADERQAAAAERIRLLEQRVQSLDSDGGGQDERLRSVTAERDHLDGRLSEALAQLSEAKCEAGERARGLEAQVAKLGARLAEERQELQESLRQQQREATGLAESLSAAETKAAEAASRVAGLEELLEQREHELQRLTGQLENAQADLEAERHSFQAELQAASRQLQDERLAHRQALSAVQAKLDSSVHQLQERADLIAKLERQGQALTEEVQTLNSDIDRLRSDRFNQDLRVTELASLKDSSAAELRDLQRKLQAAKREAGAAQAEAEKLQSEKLSLEQRLSAAESEARAATAAHQSEAESLRAELASLESQAETAALTNSELAERVTELERERETVVVSLETESVRALRQEVQSLGDQLAERNKTVRVLQQRLLDMKKTLQRELRLQQQPCPRLPNEPAASDPAAAATAAAATDEDSTNGGGAGGLESAEGELVNLLYLKHVLLKFLLTREDEAQHLVRALSALLHCSPEEEKMLRKALRHRTAWFVSKPRLSDLVPPNL
ncbi:hypothetical protein BOX15_Mlig000165g1, partial [Macrostomum lignano]